MLETIAAAPPDPILGLSEAYRADPNPEKINLAVGVYQDEAGRTPVLTAVRSAEQQLLKAGGSKAYLPIDGPAEFKRLTQTLLLGDERAGRLEGRIRTAATPGGTGALRLTGDFLHDTQPDASVWLPNPTWANHNGVMAAAGVPVQRYAYLDAANHGFDFSGMLADLERAPAGDVILLHACCHNPSGVDPSPQQWQTIADLLNDRGLVPMIDFAYQGFGEGVEQDAVGLRAVIDTCPEVLIASSYSKNFGLYQDRVGAFTLVASNVEDADAAWSRVKQAARRNWSNPPAHGPLVVQAILADAKLRKKWLDELDGMRQRIQRTRGLLRSGLNAAGIELGPDENAFITQQKGMFTMTGLPREQVDRLRTEHGVYIVGSGRINVAGLNEDSVPKLLEALRVVRG